MTTSNLDGSRPIFLFDSVCVLCDSAVRYVLKHEQKPDLLFISIQSKPGRELATAYGIDPDNPETFIFIENNVPHFKSDGVIALSQHLNGFARLTRLGKIIPRTIRDWMYEKIAKNRYRIFGKMENCIVPEPQVRERFVL